MSAGFLSVFVAVGLVSEYVTGWIESNAIYATAVIGAGFVALGVAMQITRTRNPNRPATPANVIIDDDSANLSSFSHPGAVANHETRSLSIRREFAVFLACVQDAFELELTEFSILHELVSQRVEERIFGRRKIYARQRSRLGDVSWMDLSSLCRVRRRRRAHRQSRSLVASRRESLKLSSFCARARLRSRSPRSRYTRIR